uniref:Transmembrane protein 67 n=1 Tax=Oreochromis niloticus TaxID=8128 RepID=I3JFI6_ORENI
MATETLPFLVIRHKVPVTLFILMYIDLLWCQPFTIPFRTPSDCGAEEFFDISSLSCVRCGPNQRRSTTGLSCVCQSYVSSYSVLCFCLQGVTKDGFGCIRCPGSLNNDGKCQCPPGDVLVERGLNGTLLEEARCETCDEDSPALSVPNRNGDRYIFCLNKICLFEEIYITHCTLNEMDDFAVPLLHRNQIKSNQITFIVTSHVQVHWYSTFVFLQGFSNLTACQALGNMCVMNMHSFSSASTDACGLFNTISRFMGALSSTQGIPYWRANLPWLYYGDEPGHASPVLQNDPVPIGFSFRGKNKNTDFRLLAAVYDVRGEFLRWEQVGGQNLQLCPQPKTKQAAAFSFGTAYKESCVLSVAQLFATHPEPLFYDVFLDLGGGANTKLLPLPTLIQNQQYNGRFINQESMSNWYLSRRMFLVDTLSGREKSTSSQPKVIRVASSVKIRFQLVPRTQEGKVFPPLMTVTYTDVLITDLNTQTVTTFAVEYEMDQSEARLKTDIALGVLGGVAVLYSLLKTISWKRRIASSLIDLETMVKFLLFYAGDLANVFFAVTVGTGLYWLIFYKAQQFVSVLLPLPAQEEQFVTYIGCAFALKAVQFLHKLALQVTVDIFLIDWERPRTKTNRSVPVSGESKHDTSPVSIWRTYFVANEWNEIQTIRKISPTFQIMAVLFFLEVLGFSNLALRDPWSNLQRSPEEYTPSYSLTLRYGVAATLWLCIGLLQVIFFTVFYAHFVEDKIRQFVDLCSVSNISVFILSYRCFGYYIHGRSVHGHADTNMEEMNNNLRREAESLCAQRGLLPNTEVQTFQVSLTGRLGLQYKRIQESISRRNQPSRLTDASALSSLEPHFKAYQAMNHFLGSVIDHAHSDMDYIVKDKLMFENVIGMEFLEPTEKSIFYNDEAHTFSNVLYYGNEATLLIFDTLFFCVVDLGSQSFVLAAVLTYVQQVIFRFLRNSLGRKNLANKTLVDERFLI